MERRRRGRPPLQALNSTQLCEMHKIVDDALRLYVGHFDRDFKRRSAGESQGRPLELKDVVQGSEKRSWPYHAMESGRKVLAATARRLVQRVVWPDPRRLVRGDPSADKRARKLFASAARFLDGLKPAILGRPGLRVEANQSEDVARYLCDAGIMEALAPYVAINKLKPARDDIAVTLANALARFEPRQTRSIMNMLAHGRQRGLPNREESIIAVLLGQP